MTTTAKLLALIKHNARKKPITISPSAIAKKWNCTPNAIRCALHALVKSGAIKRVDSHGEHATGRSIPVYVRVLQKAITLEHGLPFSREDKAALAKEFGVKTSTIHSCIHHLRKDYIAFVYDKHLLIYKEDKALELLAKYDTANVPQRKHGHCYYMYAKDLPKRKKAKEELPKVLKKCIKHLILEYVVNAGGDLWIKTAKLSNEIGVCRRSVNRCLSVLEKDGYIAREPNHIAIQNMDKVYAELHPFCEGLQQKPNTQKNPPSSIYNKEPSIFTTKKVINDINVVNILYGTAVTNVNHTYLFLEWLKNIYTTKKEIELMRARYPKNYTAGQEKIAMKLSTLSNMDNIDPNSDELRQKRGIMWGNACSVMSRILTGTMQLFDIGGYVNDETYRFAAKEMRGMLATVEMPDNDTAEMLADWVEGELPEDEECIGYIQEFIRNAGVSFVGEFIARGGIQFMCHLMHYSMCEITKNRQAYAFQVLMYLSHIGFYRFDAQYPERFRKPDFAEQQLSNSDNLYAKEALSIALYRYIIAGNSLSSISYNAAKIAKMLIKQYPKRGEEGFYLTCAVDELLSADVCEDAADTIREWIDKYTPEYNSISNYHYDDMTFTAQWYDAKADDANGFGFPGDVEILRQKSSALRRWHLLSDDGKKSLIGLLNKPTRYDDPRLGFSQWDSIAKISNDNKQHIKQHTNTEVRLRTLEEMVDDNE